MTLNRIVGLRFFAIFVAILSVAGCAEVRPNDAESTYPKSFPKLIQPTASFFTSLDCPSLTGWYQNKGVRIDSDGSEHEIVLTRDLLKLGDLFSEDDEIHISVDNKEEKKVSFITVPILRIKIVSRSGISWQADDWQKMDCLGGYLRLGESRFGGGGVVLVGSGKQILFLPAVDGSLVGKSIAATSGLILIVPFQHVSEEFHLLFPSANYEGPGAQ